MYSFTYLDKQSKEETQKSSETSPHKKATTTPKAKIDVLGESTTDKDTEDETEKKSMPKVLDETKEEDIERVTEDLQLSEDDSDDTIVGTNENKLSVKPKKAQIGDAVEERTSDRSDIESNKNSSGEEIQCKNTAQSEVSILSDQTEEYKKQSSISKPENKDGDLEAPEEELIEVEDQDDYLIYLEDILKNIHKAYYQEYDLAKQSEKTIPDLKIVIPNVKRQVLKGCHLVFSGLVPSHIPLQQSRAYLVAISLGATVSADISPGCTHLVAARPGTAKVNSSRRQKGIIIVTPLWLWHCAERWERLDERLYPLG